MQYWTARWIVKPWDRKSLSFYLQWTKNFLEDSIYIWDSFYDGTCIKYFFTLEDWIKIPKDIETALDVVLMTTKDIKKYLREQTKLEEHPEKWFKIQEANEEMNILDEYITII